MTFFQSFVLAFGLLLSFSSSIWAECPVLDINGSKVELYEDATSYADDLLELKSDLVELGEDVDFSDIPNNNDNLAFVNGDCNDLALFKKTIWFFNGDLRFVDFAKRIIKVEEKKMELFLNTGYVQKAMDSADVVIYIEELFELKGSFTGLFFFLLISFLLRKAQAAHCKEKYLRSATMNFFPMYSQCKEVRHDMAKDQVVFKKKANHLFILKGRLAVYCILLSLLGSIVCNAAEAAPKQSIWDGRTTQGKCKRYKKAIKKAVKQAVKSSAIEAGQMFIRQATSAYSRCLKKAFHKALLKKIKGLKGKHLSLDNGFNINKNSFLNEAFVDKLISTGYYLHSPVLKDVVLMAKVYLHRQAIEKAVEEIEEIKVLSR